MSFEKINNVYFLGIGGIGMSALARYFKAQGKIVSGYDKTPTTLTDELIAEGISVHFIDSIAVAQLQTSNLKDTTLVIYTPAVPKDLIELNYFLSNGFDVKKRSEVLGMITENHYTIAVAGTHGKTTTSSMIAHILKHSGTDCTAFLGGIAKNYDSNFLLGKGKKSIVVVEADEYDRSFLTLHPDVAVITSMDADHLDIYGDSGQLVDSYRSFAKQLKKGGMLFYKSGLQLEDLELGKSTYSLTATADYSPKNLRIENHRYHFDFKNTEDTIKDISSQLAGAHNVENALAAIAVAKHIGIPKNKIKEALETYTGVKRRFDYQVQPPTSNVVYIDDYAHHPEELRACISSARELYPGKKITGIFQPHLFSRTRDFAEGFGRSLSLLDELILLDIYPAREKPIAGVNSGMLLKDVTIKNKMPCRKEDVLEELEKRNIEVLLTLGAGDIDTLVVPIRHYLMKKYAN